MIKTTYFTKGKKGKLMLFRKLQNLTKDYLELCSEKAEQFIDEQQTKIDKLKAENSSNLKRAAVEENSKQNNKEETTEKIKKITQCNKLLERTLSEANLQKYASVKGEENILGDIESDMQEKYYNQIIKSIKVTIEFNNLIIEKLKGE